MYSLLLLCPILPSPKRQFPPFFPVFFSPTPLITTPTSVVVSNIHQEFGFSGISTEYINNNKKGGIVEVISTFKKALWAGGRNSKTTFNHGFQRCRSEFLTAACFPGKQVTEQEFHPLPMFYLGGLCISLGWLRCIGAVAVE